MDTTRKVIWTIGHRPFVMGGSVYYPLGTEEDCLGPYEIGKGFSCYLTVAPNGVFYVVEATTGAIVAGHSLDDVRKDVNNAAPGVIEDQIRNAAEQAKKVELVDRLEFWRRMKALPKSDL